MGTIILRRRLLFGGVVILLAPVVVYFTRGSFARIWGDLHIVNFVVAAIPTILSILFAFIIDKDLERHMRTRWRLSIVGVGMLYSLFLWHQQDLTDRANAKQTADAVNSAVKQANVHSDEQIGHVRDDVKEVRKDLQGSVNRDDLNKTSSTITSSFSSTQTQLAAEIEKLKPIPAERAKLQFSLYKEEMNNDPSSFPLLIETITAEPDGTFLVPVFFRNSATQQAVEGADIWLSICTVCSFASESSGLNKPTGSIDNMRHASFPLLNPKAFAEVITLHIKINASFPIRSQIGFRYSCKTCDPDGYNNPQYVTLIVMPKPPS